MTNYREILRMHSLGFNKTEISQSLTCSRTTVRTVIHLAESLGLSYPLPKDMSDKALYEALFPSAAGKAKYKMPDYEHVYKELQRDGVTLDLLWREYVEECRTNGELPYQSTQFNKYYNDFCAKKNATMQNHLKSLLTAMYELHTSELLPEVLPAVFLSFSNAKEQETDSVGAAISQNIVRINEIITTAFVDKEDQIKCNAQLTEAFESFLDLLIEFNVEMAAVILDEFRIH